MVEAACGSALPKVAEYIARVAGASPRAGILRADGALNDMDTLVVTRNILPHTRYRLADTYSEPSTYLLGTNAF